VWRVFEPVFPSMGHSPAPYVIVGMMSCFGGISRAPLAVMLMVAEMTGSLSIITPAMVAVGISWLIVRQRRHHLPQPAEEPGRRTGPAAPGRASSARRHPDHSGHGQTPHGDHDGAKAAMTVNGRVGSRRPQWCAGGRWRRSLRGHLVPCIAHSRSGSAGGSADLADAGAPTVAANSRLDVALESLTEAPLSWVPVLDGERRVVGTLSISDVVRAYRQELAASAERMSELGTASEPRRW
jgi:CIC family chloride channel protein